MKLNQKNKAAGLLKKLLFLFACMLLLFFTDCLNAQQQSASMRVGRFWTGITDNAYWGNFTYTSGFFPNDYDILGWRGQYEKFSSGSGFQIGTLMFYNPYGVGDSLHYPSGIPIDTVAVYGPVNDFLPTGKVVVPLTNYIRYKYPDQTIVNPTSEQTVSLSDFGNYDPSKFTDL